MRPFRTYHTIQRMTDRNTTLCLMSADQWTSEADEADEFDTYAKAQRRADRVGGEVFEHARLATAF